MSAKNTSTLGRHIASVAATSARIGDCISDARMDEIARRLMVQLEDSVLSDVIKAEAPPSDTSKLWFDTKTKKLFEWNPESNAWTETSVSDGVCIAGATDNLLRRDDTGCLLVLLSESEDNLLEVDDEGNLLMRKIARAERFDLSIVSDGSGNASTTITITEFTDDKAGISVMPKADLGANARWWVSAQTTTTATINFAGLANSTTYAIAVMAQQTNLSA